MPLIKRHEYLDNSPDIRDLLDIKAEEVASK